MAYNHEWPYTDTGRANTDWEINQVKELTKKVDLEFSEAIKEFIMRNFNELFAGLSYVPETHTLKMYLGVVGDGEHVYTPSDETMTII